jgi:hypothetical protein
MGQQVVIEGPHAKGSMHYWRNEVSLVDHVSELPEVDVKQIDSFFISSGAARWRTATKRSS